jgi:ABC-2 type transport system ATP-binding protein
VTEALTDAPGSMAGPAIRCTELTHSFGATRALDDVSFDVASGGTFGLLGPNGAGKTTTIRVLTTLLRADHGAAAVFGTDVRRQPMRVRRLLGYVPQQLSADASLTGWENVWLFARLFDVPRRERTARIDAALEDVFGHHTGDTLDGAVLVVALCCSLFVASRLLDRLAG